MVVSFGEDSFEKIDLLNFMIDMLYLIFKLSFLYVFIAVYVIILLI